MLVRQADAPLVQVRIRHVWFVPMPDVRKLM